MMPMEMIISTTNCCSGSGKAGSQY